MFTCLKSFVFSLKTTFIVKEIVNKHMREGYNEENEEEEEEVKIENFLFLLH